MGNESFPLKAERGAEAGTSEVDEYLKQEQCLSSRGAGGVNPVMP